MTHTATTRKSTGLARPGDPLVTHKGEIVPPKGRTLESLKDAVKAEEFRPMRRGAMKELSAKPAVMNGINAVFVYTMLGISDIEIAHALKITVEDVRTVRTHTAYAEVFDAVLDEFINSNSELIQVRLAKYSHAALTKVADLSQNSESEGISLRASQDILDRAGQRAVDNVGRRQAGQMNELRIILVDGEKNVQLDINMQPETE